MQSNNQNIRIEMSDQATDGQVIRREHGVNDTTIRSVSTLSQKLLSKNMRDAILIIVMILICICTVYSTMSNPHDAQSSESAAKQAAMLRALYKVMNTIGGVAISPIQGIAGNDESNPRSA